VQDAFREALSSAPLVVAIGEAHAQKGATAPSSAKRFSEVILPTLQGRASDLLVELMMPPQGCAKKTAEVKKKQEEVTSKQAATDQNEYLSMGERARVYGIVPDMLRPTCADMDAIRDAGDGAIGASLETIARLTASQVKKLVDRDAHTPGEEGKIVVTYGGALHNDLDPAPEMRAWVFGPEIDAYVKGRYVAIDLYVPEYIEDTEVWKKLPWYPLYDGATMSGKTTMFKTGERSLVIIFPRAQ
jgi:hypothetical protein